VSKEAIQCADKKLQEISNEWNANHQKTKAIVGHGSDLSQTTTNTFSNNTLTTVYPNQRIEIESFSPAGNIKNITIIVGDEKRITQSQYYPAQQLVMTTHPDTLKIFELYDKDQKLEYSISSLGFVTQFIYDKQYRSCKRIEYANPINTEQLFPTLRFNQHFKKLADAKLREHLHNALLQVSDSKKDRQSYIFYDVNDNISLTVDAENYLIAYRYNVLGENIEQIEYADKITSGELTDILLGKAIERLVDTNKDRVEHYFYDQDGLQIGLQDAAGFITEYIRDAGGRVIEQIQYRYPVLKRSDDFTQIRPETMADDGHTYYLYNTLNQCIAEVNPEGYVTTSVYEPDGKIKNANALC
jgi:YD repeat-containing protein